MVRKGATRLTPCKTDKPKKRKFNNKEAYCVQIPCALGAFYFQYIKFQIEYNDKKYSVKQVFQKNHLPKRQKNAAIEAAAQKMHSSVAAKQKLNINPNKHMSNRA